MKNILSTLLALLWCAVSQASDGVGITRFGDDDGLSHSIVTCVMQDSYGYIWLSSREGLIRYDGYNFVTYKAMPGDGSPLLTNRIDMIDEAPGGDILCKSVDKYYYVFDRHTCRFRVYDGPKPPVMHRYKASAAEVGWIAGMERYAGMEVRVLYRDRQGGYWVWSNKGMDRVVKVRKPLKPVRLGGGSGDEVVRAMMRDSHSRVWIADKNGYVHVIKSGEKPMCLGADGRLVEGGARFGHNVYCMAEDSEGNIWLGTKPGGLFRLRPEGTGFAVDRYVHRRGDAYSLSCDKVYSICFDGSGRMWVGTYGGGVNIVEKPGAGHISFINKNHRLSGYPAEAVKVRCLHPWRGGTMLIGTGGGLYSCRLVGHGRGVSAVFTANRRDPYDAHSLSNNEVMGMAADGHGDVYVATYGGGVNKVLAGSAAGGRLRFQAYTMADGLASDVNINITADGQGALWVVSENSLTCFDTRKGSMTNYANGFMAEGFAFTEARPLALGADSLAFGTTRGVFSFGREDARKSGYVPNIVFGCDSSVSLKPEEKSFTITFSALDYNKAEDIWYAYRMDGVDKDWVFTKNHEISYAVIPPGCHVFRVRSTNGDGVWVDNERTVTIRRRPELSEMPATWVALGVLLVGMAWLAVRTVKYVRRLRCEMDEVRRLSREKVDMMMARIRELLAERRGADSDGQDNGDGTPDERFRDAVIGIISANIGNADLSVDMLCRELGVSRTVLYLRMKKVFGRSPNNLVLEMRVKRALAYMAEGGMSVADVAYRCGFSDPKYFSRCFKKIMGCSPTEYIRKANPEV